MKKKILIIGGTSGIGLELARSLNATHELTVASRHSGPLAELGIRHISLDVLEDILDSDIFPESLDGLVYAPGSINLKPFKMLSEDAFRQDLEVNFMGLIRVLKAVMPRFSKGASLVLFSTVAVSSGMPFHASVAAAKGAVEGFARALAAEYAPKLRVNVIAPSLVDTPLAERLLNNDKKREKMSERHPLGRVGQPADIARCAAYLLSDESSWVTGQVLRVDGGISTLNLA